MSTGVVCTVYLDGIRAADGSPGDNLMNPTVLDDLAVTWGRSDTMSQPDPDACTFDVMDLAGGTAFVDVYRTGRRVDVVATGETYPDPTVPTFENPGFETAAITWATTAATATRSTTRAHTGAYALNVKPSTSAPGTVLLAPAPFAAPGTEPDAWDAIPTTSIGQSWSSSIAILAPAGAAVTVHPVRFNGPYVDAATVLPAVDHVTGSGAWQVVTFEATTQVDGAWIGVQLVIDPIGPTWDQMPPTLTWDGVEPTLEWDELGSIYVDDVSIMAPGGGTGRGVLVFSGRITDTVAAWDDGVGGPVVKVTAAGFTADLQNRTIGSDPWPVESVDERSHRILDLAGLPISIDIADTLDVTLLSYRDVDAQGATGLLHEVATSVDGVLWPAVHQTIGAYLELEDPSQRASLLRLVDVPGPPAELLHTNLATNPDAEAFGAVTTQRTNWVANPVPASITGYSRAGTVTSTVTFETTGGPSISGGAWIKNAITQVAAGTDNQLNVGGQVTGQHRHVSAWLYASKALSLRIAGWTYDAAGTYLGSANDITTGNFSIPANTWTRVEGALSTPPTAYSRVQSFIRVVAATPVLAPDVYGCAMLTFSDVPGGTFNGSTPAAGDFTYAWSGTANGSTSLQRAPTTAGNVVSFGQASRWSSVVEHDVGARSFGVMPSHATAQGLIWTVPTLTTGQTITAIIRVKGAAGLPLQLHARTSGGAGTGVATSFVCTGAWQTVAFSHTAVDGTTIVGVQLLLRTPYPIGIPFYVDQTLIVVEPAAYTGPYFDGRTPSTETMAYAWTAGADASTSTQTTIQQHTIVIEPKDPDSGFDLSACQVLRDPVQWTQTVTDVITRVAVGWLVQGIDDKGLPTTTEATVQIVDADLEVLYGTRRVQVSTQLQAEDDATDVAARILARSSVTDWRADGLTLDDDEIPAGPEGVALLLDMLDGTSRIGAPIVLGDLPSWSPGGATAGVYLEGGTYRFVGGRWVLDLLVSSASGLGQSVAWDELDPAWTWNNWDPAITWNDLRGVAAP